jgi:hypothetical protein
VGEVALEDWKTRDYFAEMYVAGVLADAGWDVYFPRRDRGFDMIVSRPAGETTLVRPVQVKGKYATEGKTDKARYGFVGELTAFHDDMILAMPYFTSERSEAPALIAWMPHSEIRVGGRGWRCEPAQFVGNKPVPRPSFAHYFGDAGLMRFAVEADDLISRRRPPETALSPGNQQNENKGRPEEG